MRQIFVSLTMSAGTVTLNYSNVADLATALAAMATLTYTGIKIYKELKK